MARPKLRHPGQPPWLQLLLGLYEAAASLKLAVFVIGASAVVLAWATFVEKWYGTEAVNFAIYQSWWFGVLLGLLGLNVLSAALIRFPWKKHQTGFVITHAGILVLLAGCFVQRVWGTNAHIVVYEGEAEHMVFKDEKLLRLTIASTDSGSAGSKPEQIDVPFRSGPFNWDVYDNLVIIPWTLESQGEVPFVRIVPRGMFFLPWRITPRDQGLIYQKDGIELEVLDYLADSKRVVVPRLVLEVTPAAGSPHAVMGAGGPSRLEMAVVAEGGPHAPRRPNGIGARQQTALGPNVVFWLAATDDESKAFLASGPEGDLGTSGQIVLWHQGKTYRFGVEELQKQPDQSLGDTGLKMHFGHYDPRFRGVQVEIRRGDEPPASMLLYANEPHISNHAGNLGVYGAYWVEPPPLPASLAHSAEAMALRTAAAQRLDVLLGRDGKLYYREWIAPKVASAGPWPDDGQGDVAGSRLAAFKGTAMAMQFRAAEFLPESSPKVLIEPRPFEREDKERTKQPRARVRLTVDGNSGEFWLPLGGPRTRDEVAAVAGKDRRVDVILGQETFELGFQIFLRDFTRKVDAGAPSESHFSSLVDVLDRGEDPKTLKHAALITMNQPLSATDPKSGRTYRFYQASFAFVGKPGEPEFDQRVYGEGNKFFKPAPREDLFRSILSLNYDPGRGLKYAGSLLIVAGIVTMFYMRAYFFRRREPDPATAA